MSTPRNTGTIGKYKSLGITLKKHQKFGSQLIIGVSEGQLTGEESQDLGCETQIRTGFVCLVVCLAVCLKEGVMFWPGGMQASVGQCVPQSLMD